MYQIPSKCESGPIQEPPTVTSYLVRIEDFVLRKGRPITEFYHKVSNFSIAVTNTMTKVTYKKNPFIWGS